MGSLDRAMGHKQRFSTGDLKQALGAAGFGAVRFYQLNRIGAVAWWISGQVFHRKRISKLTLKLFDKSVWFWRLIDSLLPWHGLSLVAVAERTPGAAKS